MFTLSAAGIAKVLGIQLADLSTVENPQGRLDFLASQLVAAAVKDLSPEAQATYQAGRQIIDGYFVKTLGGIRIKTDDVKQIFEPLNGAETGKAA